MLSADPTASLLGEYQSVSARSITSVLLNLLWRGINYCPRRPGILQLKHVLRKGHFLWFKQARVPCLVKGELQTPGDGAEMLALLQQGCWAGQDLPQSCVSHQGTEIWRQMGLMAKFKV